MKAKSKLVCILVWFLSLTPGYGQVEIQDIPNQTIGLGGQFSEINLSGYSVGDPVVWEVAFPLSKSSTSAPQWSVRSADYQFEMNITAVIASKGAAAKGSSHLLAILDNHENVRGVASAIEVADSWVYFMTVYGNLAGTELQFVFYDANYQEVLKGGEINFNPNAVIGQPDDPYVINAEILNLTLDGSLLKVNITDKTFIGTEKVVITATGVDNPSDVHRDTVDYSVISDYEPILEEIPNQVVGYGEPFDPIDLESFTRLEDGDLVTYSAIAGDQLSVQINESTSLATISYPAGWAGSEIVTFTVTDQTTQQFKASRDVSFTVRPEEVAPIVSGLEDQTIGTGGIPESIDLSAYLQTNNPEGIVWSYKVYEEHGAGSPIWEVNPSSFELSMTMTCAVSSYGREISGENHRLAVFQQSDSLLVGVAEAIEVGMDWYFFLTVYGGTKPEELFFRFYDADFDKVINVIEKESFVSNAVLGDPLAPVHLQAGYIAPEISGNMVEFNMLDETWSGEEQFIFIATDTTTANKLSGQDTLKIEVIDIKSPTLAEIPTQEIYEGENFGPINLENYLGGVTLDQVTFSISGADTLSPVMSNNRVNVTLPGTDYFGSAVLSVNATHNDFPNLMATRQVEYRVVNVNDPPTIVGEEPATEVYVGELYQYEINGLDIDDTSLELKVTGNPEWLVFVKNGAFGLLFGTPSATDAGQYDIHIELTDGEATITKSFTVEVVNSYAKLTSAPDQITDEGSAFGAFDLTTITDKTDDYPVTYSITGGSELTYSLEGTLLSIIVPDMDWYGSETFTIQLLDQNNSDAILDEVTITFEVINVNDAPVIITESLPNLKVLEGFEELIEVSDIDDSQFNYTITGLPSWLKSVSTAAGLLLYGTPSRTDFGIVSLSIEVSDGELTATKSFEFEVANSYALLNTPSIQSISEGEVFSVFDLLSITDKTDDFKVGYSITGGEALSPVVSGSSLIVNIPDENWFGQESMIIQMLDSLNDLEIIDEVNILYEVINVNDVPEIITTELPDAGRELTYSQTIKTVDVDGDSLGFRFIDKPDWIDYSPTTAGIVLFGFPQKKDVGVRKFTLELFDQIDTVSQEYSITVKNKLILDVEDTQFLIYPNPTSEKIHVSSLIAIKAYTIYNLSGQIVLSKVRCNRSDLDINLNALSNGEYILKIETKEKIVTRKIILRK